MQKYFCVCIFFKLKAELQVSLSFVRLR